MDELLDTTGVECVTEDSSFMKEVQNTRYALLDHTLVIKAQAVPANTSTQRAGLTALARFKPYNYKRPKS